MDKELKQMAMNDDALEEVCGGLAGNKPRVTHLDPGQNDNAGTGGYCQSQKQSVF